MPSDSSIRHSALRWLALVAITPLITAPSPPPPAPPWSDLPRIIQDEEIILRKDGHYVIDRPVFVRSTGIKTRVLGHGATIELTHGGANTPIFFIDRPLGEVVIENVTLVGPGVGVWHDQSPKSATTVHLKGLSIDVDEVGIYANGANLLQVGTAAIGQDATRDTEIRARYGLVATPLGQHPPEVYVRNTVFAEGRHGVGEQAISFDSGGPVSEAHQQSLLMLTDCVVRPNAYRVGVMARFGGQIQLRGANYLRGQEIALECDGIDRLSVNPRDGDERNVLEAPLPMVLVGKDDDSTTVHLERAFLRGVHHAAVYADHCASVTVEDVLVENDPNRVPAFGVVATDCQNVRVDNLKGFRGQIEPFRARTGIQSVNNDTARIERCSLECTEVGVAFHGDGTRALLSSTVTAGRVGVTSIDGLMTRIGEPGAGNKITAPIGVYEIDTRGKGVLANVLEVQSAGGLFTNSAKDSSMLFNDDYWFSFQGNLVQGMGDGPTTAVQSNNGFNGNIDANIVRDMDVGLDLIDSGLTDWPDDWNNCRSSPNSRGIKVSNNVIDSSKEDAIGIRMVDYQGILIEHNTVSVPAPGGIGVCAIHEDVSMSTRTAIWINDFVVHMTALQGFENEENPFFNDGQFWNNRIRLTGLPMGVHLDDLPEEQRLWIDITGRAKIEYHCENFNSKHPSTWRLFQDRGADYTSDGRFVQSDGNIVTNLIYADCTRYFLGHTDNPEIPEPRYTYHGFLRHGPWPIGLEDKCH